MATIENPVTKENFFNALYEAYPEKVETFCKWVDEYKEQCGYYEIIGRDVKYHDLPHAMQLGIWLQFLVDTGNDAAKINLRESMTNYFQS